MTILRVSSDGMSFFNRQGIYVDGNRLALNHVMPMTWDPVGTSGEN